MKIPKIDLPRVVILGGGFAGLKLARNINSKYFQTVIIDRNNYHTFQPLMYQVATAGLAPDSIAYPLRKTLKRKKNTFFRMAEVEQVNLEEKLVVTSIGAIKYDYLIVATGATTNYFGNANVEKYSMPMKSLLESIDIRSLMLQNFEHALNLTNIQEQDEYLNFVIVGAGPTGVELAGALAELKSHVLPKDYPDLDIRRMQIHLIEAGPKVLAAMSDKSSRKATQFLRKMGVNLWLDTYVKDYDGTVITTNNDTFHTKTLIWAAGVKGIGINGLDDQPSERGRYLVDEVNRIQGLTDVFAIGDISMHKTDETPDGLPMLASVAQQQGKALAKNLLRLQKSKPTKPFEYTDKGTMATIGRNKAVVDLTFYTFTGFFAWLTWMFVHLMLLVDFRNRMMVLVNWVWSYVNFDRGTRLMIRKFKRKS